MTSNDEKGQAKARTAIARLGARGGIFVKAVEATRMPMAVTDPTLDGNPIIYVNDAFVSLCGYGRDEVLGRNYHFLVGPHTDAAVAPRVDRALSAREDITEEVLFYRKDGREIWVSMFVCPVMKDGRVVQHFTSFQDITDRVVAERRLKEANETLERRVAERTRELESLLRQKEFLVEEIDHRTRNVVATAASLLRIQAAQSGDERLRSALAAAEARLLRIAEVQQLLYRGTTPDRIDVPRYLRQLVHALRSSLLADPDRVDLEVVAADAVWPPDLALPVGLIVNEAVTNAFKHAFAGVEGGRLLVELRPADEGAMRLRIADDGRGLATERRQGALGLRLIETLAERLDGRASVAPNPEGGVSVVVLFPDPVRPA